MMDYQEGYCDGLAGAGVQMRPLGLNDAAEYVLRRSYEKGFMFGSVDRKIMLHRETAYDRWADGLMDATTGDVMQPVQPGLRADGMGDGDA